MSVTEFPPLLSEEDLQKYRVPLRWRDRCATYFALYHTCLIRQSANSSVSCKHDKHAWEECENLDYIRRQNELKVAKEKRKAELAEAAESD
ncbi:NADH-ubiquinone oxidoreductase B18 subunit (CI-B18) [Scheffersomyces coipomensis]|uniref:NADH-ubiquinone oxidoreductase B18 subunit (CI-B18) n=1 Tax=Scheffersomyces coipomensis TaxID=1788519 RepID=UPI00315D2008